MTFLSLDDIARDDVQPLAGRAIHELALDSRPPCSTLADMLLREQADAAIAVEGHAELAFWRRAGEVADEFRALVLAGDDLAGAGPCGPRHIAEELALRSRSLGMQRGNDSAAASTAPAGSDKDTL
jgi:hypothetical protein